MRSLEIQGSLADGVVPEGTYLPQTASSSNTLRLTSSLVVPSREVDVRGWTVPRYPAIYNFRNTALLYTSTLYCSDVIFMLSAALNGCFGAWITFDWKEPHGDFITNSVNAINPLRKRIYRPLEPINATNLAVQHSTSLTEIVLP